MAWPVHDKLLDKPLDELRVICQTARRYLSIETLWEKFKLVSFLLFFFSVYIWVSQWIVHKENKYKNRL